MGHCKARRMELLLGLPHVSETISRELDQEMEQLGLKLVSQPQPQYGMPVPQVVAKQHTSSSPQKHFLSASNIDLILTEGIAIHTQTITSIESVLVLGYILTALRGRNHT